MELKDFIKTTLRELSEAIDESGIELEKKVMLTNTTLRTKQMGDYGLIDFDLAVDVKDTKSTGGGGKFKIAVVEANLGKDTQMVSSASSRIKFTVEAGFDSYDAQVKAKEANKPKTPTVE